MSTRRWVYGISLKIGLGTDFDSRDLPGHEAQQTDGAQVTSYSLETQGQSAGSRRWKPIGAELDVRSGRYDLDQKVVCGMARRRAGAVVVALPIAAAKCCPPRSGGRPHT